MYQLSRNFYTTEYPNDAPMGSWELFCKKTIALTLGVVPYASATLWLNLFHYGFDKIGEGGFGVVLGAKSCAIKLIKDIKRCEELEKERFIETVPGKGSYVAIQNRELMKEKKLKIIEEKLTQVVDDSKLMGFSFEEINEILKILFEED